MKHTLTLTLAILLLAATGWGQPQTNQVVLRLEKLEDSMQGQTNELLLGTSPPPVALNYMACSASNEVLNVESHIRKLAASGEICKVFGHWYPNVWFTSEGCKCVLCGKVKQKRRCGNENQSNRH